MKPVQTILLSLTLIAGSASAEEADLIKYMGDLQLFSHKTGLAIDHKNRKLASFYVHEIEHTLEDVMKVESFDGHPVGKLAGDIIEPAFEKLEDALESGSWEDISARYDGVLDACNYCHKSTDHAYIRITRQTDNPYMQSFAPLK